MKKPLFICLIITIFSSFVLAYSPGKMSGTHSTVVSVNYGYHQRGNEQGRYQTLIKELNLSKDQIKAINKLREDNLKKNRVLMTDLQKARTSLNKELGKTTLNEKRINELQDYIVVIQKHMLENHINLIKEHRKVLNSEQIKRLGEIMNRIEENRSKKIFDYKNRKYNPTR